MQPLAARTARAIAKSKDKSVVVFGFVGPDKNFTELGRALTEQFGADLAKSTDRFSVTKRGRIAENLANKGLNPGDVRDVDFASWITSDLSVESFVFGTLTRSGDGLNIEVDCYSVKSGKRIDRIKTASSISEEMRKLISQTVEYPIPDSYSGIPTPGKNGYGYPRCDYCPPATYTSQAVKNHVQGTVILTVVVGADGRASDIVVKKPLPDGLTDTAIAAVKSLKFSPALGPDGKPAGVRQVIEVTFHI
jgi:TonB family protein